MKKVIFPGPSREKFPIIIILGKLHLYKENLWNKGENDSTITNIDFNYNKTIVVVCLQWWHKISKLNWMIWQTTTTTYLNLDYSSNEIYYNN